MMAEGDHDGAEVTLRALGDLARLVRRSADGVPEREGVAGATVTRLSAARKRAGDGNSSES
jgi:hypothetical protein